MYALWCVFLSVCSRRRPRGVGGGVPPTGSGDGIGEGQGRQGPGLVRPCTSGASAAVLHDAGGGQIARRLAPCRCVLLSMLVAARRADASRLLCCSAPDRCHRGVDRIRLRYVAQVDKRHLFDREATLAGPGRDARRACWRRLPSVMYSFLPMRRTGGCCRRGCWISGR